MGFLDQLKAVWPLVMQAPSGFAPLMLALLLAGWVAGRFMFNERIETLKGRIERRDEKIAELERRSVGTPAVEDHGRVRELEHRLKALEPKSLTPEQIQKIGAILAKQGGPIKISRT